MTSPLSTVLSSGAHLRAEQEAGGRLDDIKRLDAERIARGEEFAGRDVDRDEGIHADHALQRAVAPDLQRVGQHLGVGFGLELDAEVGKIAPQFDVIVDLAVEGNRQPAVERDLRLDGVGGVDDAQTARAHGVFGRGDNNGSVTSPRCRMRWISFSTVSFGVGPIDGNGKSAHVNAFPVLRRL